MKNGKTNQNARRSEGITSNNSSNDKLEQRLASEVSAVERWASAMRTQATEAFRQRKERLASFAAVANQIDSVLKDKIEVLMSLNVFKTIARTEKLEGTGLPAGLFSSKTVHFKVPHSSACPAKVELTFEISHDSTIENAIVDYKLQIIPVFFKFNRVDQITVPFKDAKGKTVFDWMDDKMVEFSKTFFQIRMHDQYQKDHMATDPVMNIQFPIALAVGSNEQNGRVLHFFTKESMLEFENGPLSFPTSALRIGPNANHCI